MTNAEIISKNPKGTTYKEDGTAVNATAKAGTLDNLQQAPEGMPAFVYNEDGSIFAPAADTQDKMKQLAVDIASKQVAINSLTNKLNTSKEMLADAIDSDKPVFQKAIDAQGVAIATLQGDMGKLNDAMKALKLSLITPGDRKKTVRLAEAEAQIKSLMDEITQLKTDLKITASVAQPKTPKDNSIGRPAAGTGATSVIPTPAQKAAREAAVAQFGTQGKAIIELVKQGLKNSEIAEVYGINPASVPGPRTDWKRSEEGIAFMAANPDVVK